MARTLPWLKNVAPAKAASTTHAKPAKRQRMLDRDSNSESENDGPRRAAREKKRQAALRAERPPSTSPPPEPLTEEPMRPGLSADDIYIMVEDEFHAVAQQFTKHLHHAEYLRLKNVAKTRNASAINTISRPTDSVTVMREETKMKKQAKAQEAKTKAGVEKVIKPRTGKGAGDDSESQSDFENEEGVGDPWQGTQLQHFMTKSPRKTLTGLTGLQGVMSYTRAAAGLERPEKAVEKPRRLFEQKSSTSPLARKNIPQVTAGDSTSESEDDDDLDAPVRATSRAPSKPHAPISKPTISKSTTAPPHKTASPPATRITQTQPHSPIRKPPRRSLLDMSPLPKAYTPASSPPEPTPRKPDPPLKKEPIEVPRSSILEKDAIRRRKARRDREERERKKSAGKIGVDEIPIFLV